MVKKFQIIIHFAKKKVGKSTVSVLKWRKVYLKHIGPVKTRFLTTNNRSDALTITTMIFVINVLHYENAGPEY